MIYLLYYKYVTYHIASRIEMRNDYTNSASPGTHSSSRQIPFNLWFAKMNERMDLSYFTSSFICRYIYSGDILVLIYLSVRKTAIARNFSAIMGFHKKLRRKWCLLLILNVLIFFENSFWTRDLYISHRVFVNSHLHRKEHLRTCIPKKPFFLSEQKISKPEIDTFFLFNFASNKFK